MFDVLSKVTGRGGDGESTADEDGADLASGTTADPAELSPADFRTRAEALADRSDVPELDFSEAALPDLDAMATGTHPVDDAVTYGSYLGETLVREYDGEWVREDGWAVAVDLGDDRTTVAVFDAARMDLERGPVFEQVATHLHERGDPHAEPTDESGAVATSPTEDPVAQDSADEAEPTTDSPDGDAETDPEPGIDEPSSTDEGRASTDGAEAAIEDDRPEEATPDSAAAASTAATDDRDEDAATGGATTAEGGDAEADGDEADEDEPVAVESSADEPDGDAEPAAGSATDPDDAGDTFESVEYPPESGPDAGPRPADDAEPAETPMDDAHDGGDEAVAAERAGAAAGEHEETEAAEREQAVDSDDTGDVTEAESEAVDDGDSADAEEGSEVATPDDGDSSEGPATPSDVDGAATETADDADGGATADADAGGDGTGTTEDDGGSSVVEATSSEPGMGDDGPTEGDFSHSPDAASSRADDGDDRDATATGAAAEASTEDGAEPGVAARETDDVELDDGSAAERSTDVASVAEEPDVDEPTANERADDDASDDDPDGDAVGEAEAATTDVPPGEGDDESGGSGTSDGAGTGSESDATTADTAEPDSSDENAGATGDDPEEPAVVADDVGPTEGRPASDDDQQPAAGSTASAAAIPSRNDYEPAAIQFRNRWSGYDFDFSPESLARLDDFLDDQWDGRFRPGSLDDSSTDPEESSGPLVQVGAYVGEVLVQHYDGEWVAGEDGEPAIAVGGRHGRGEVFPVFDVVRTSLTEVARVAYAVDAMANRLDLDVTASGAEATAFALGEGGPGTDASAAAVITTILDRADAFVEEWPGYDLNYRPASLVRLDNLATDDLDGEAFRSATLGDHTDADALRLADRAVGASAYLAAVLVRHLDAQWEIDDEVALSVEGPAGETRVVPFEGSVDCLRGEDRFMKRYDRVHDAVIEESRSTG